MINTFFLHTNIKILCIKNTIIKIQNYTMKRTAKIKIWQKKREREVTTRNTHLIFLIN